MSQLPLFPLGTVLFPGVRLPLQVFEPRYVELLRDLGRRLPPERRFGVVALRRGNEVATGETPELAVMGTAARLLSIRSAAGGPTGIVLVIESVGEARFRLDSFAAVDTPYFVGEVTWLEDAPGEPEELARAAAQARDAYEAFLAAVGRTAEPVDASPDRLAYEIAEAVTLPVEDRQTLLDTGDPVRRLSLVNRFLRREALLVGGMQLMPTERYSFGAPSAN